MKKNIKLIMLRFNLIMIAASITCFVTSCDKLIEKPLGIVGEPGFYTTQEQVEAGLVGAMSQLWSGGNADLGVDDIYKALGKDAYTDLDHNGIRDFPIVLRSDFGIENWQNSYRSLVNLNNVIGAIREGRINTQNEQAKSELKKSLAHAKFLRALNYFNLVRLYGDIPLITDESPNSVTNVYSKSSIEDVYTRITMDLTDAVGELPDTWDDAPGRPTSWTAKGLLAKVYLTMATAPMKVESNYEKAASLAKEVIDSKKFTLIPNIFDVFKAENKHASEMMFAFEASPDDGVQIPIGLASKNAGGYSGGALDTSFAAHEFPNQPRRDAYIQLDVPDPIGSGDLIDWRQTFEVAPTISKFNYPYVDGALIVSKGVFSINVPILRYAEILLIYAEAINRQNGGPTQEAVDAVNLVIDRANGETGTEARANVGMTMENFENKVMQERKFEFCFELGNRWYDMVRKELTEHHIATTLFPIPEFDASIIGQNPGY